MKHVSASQFECKNNENLSLIYSRTPHQDNCSDDIINDEYMYAYTVCSCYMYVCMLVKVFRDASGLSKLVCFYKKNENYIQKYINSRTLKDFEDFEGKCRA